MTRNGILSIALCMVLATLARANITVSHTGSGTLGGSVSLVDGTTNQYDAHIIVSNMSSSGFATVTVRSNASDRLRVFTLEAWTTALSGTPRVYVDIEGNSLTAPGAIEEMRSISYEARCLPPPF